MGLKSFATKQAGATARGPIFVALNVLRAISIIALVLVFAANIMTIVDDIKAVKADKAAAASDSTSDLDKRSLPIQARRVLYQPWVEEANAEFASATITPSPRVSTTGGIVPVMDRLLISKVAEEAFASSTDDLAADSPSPSLEVNVGKIFAPQEPSATVTGSVAPTASSPSSSSASASSPSSTTSPSSVVEYKCDYYKGATVPSQAGGTFWSVLSRIFIAFECILLVLSEIGFPASLFANYIPMLGPDYGLGCLGVLQTLIASGVLSHHCHLFAQVSAWLLFMVAMANILVGIFFRAGAKPKRSISKDNLVDAVPQARAANAAWEAGQAIHGAAKGWQEKRSQASGSQSSHDNVMNWQAKNAASLSQHDNQTQYQQSEQSGVSFYSRNTPAPTHAPTPAPDTYPASQAPRSPSTMSFWGNTWNKSPMTSRFPNPFKGGNKYAVDDTEELRREAHRPVNDPEMIQRPKHSYLGGRF